MKVSHLIVPPIRHLLLVAGHVDSASIIVINTSFMIVPRPHKLVEWGRILGWYRCGNFLGCEKRSIKVFSESTREGRGQIVIVGLTEIACCNAIKKKEERHSFTSEQSKSIRGALQMQKNATATLRPDSEPPTRLLPAMPLSDIITDAASKSASRVKSQ